MQANLQVVERRLFQPQLLQNQADGICRLLSAEGLVTQRGGLHPTFAEEPLPLAVVVFDPPGFIFNRAKIAINGKLDVVAVGGERVPDAGGSGLVQGDGLGERILPMEIERPKGAQERFEEMPIRQVGAFGFLFARPVEELDQLSPHHFQRERAIRT